MISRVIPLLLLITATAPAATWHVGPSRTYTAPSQVGALVHDGDTVEIDAGVYDDCATWSANDLMLRGVGGIAHLQNVTCSDKGIWILFGTNTTIENVELSGSHISSALGSNGAGVRGQGGSFTLRHCSIHDNQMGVLCSLTDSSNVVIENSVLWNNVSADETQFAHNIYINHVDTFILRGCLVYGAQVGHQVKSRARVNYILYNKLVDGLNTASRLIDLPNGGQAVVMGNELEKGRNTQNTNSVGFGLEGMSNPGPQILTVINNTFVNNLPLRGIYITVPGSGVDTLTVVNNIFAGSGVLLSGTPRVFNKFSNIVTGTAGEAGLVDASSYDYHLLPTSAAIGAGSPLGVVGGFSLVPEFEYADTATLVPRTIIRARNIDAGAHEYGGVPSSVASVAAMPSDQVVVFQSAQSVSVRVSLNEFGNHPTISLYTLLGTRVFTGSLEGGQCTIPAAGVRSGVYVIRVDGNGMHVAQLCAIVR